MINFFLVQNRQGKVRSAKWWVPYDDAERAKLALEAHRVVNARHSKFTNFVEFRDHKVLPPPSSSEEKTTNRRGLLFRSFGTCCCV
jgi:hypothetical protein